MNIFFSKKNKKGFALVEMMVYLAIMTVVTIAMVNVVIVVIKSNKESFIDNNIKNSALSGLERIVRETRSASNIDYGQSVFNNSNGVLVLNSTDQSGNPEVIKFYINSQILKVDVSGASPSTGGILTLKGTRVTSLIFKPINTSNSKAVKIEMVIESGEPSSVKTENFYSTVILRGSY